MESLDIFKFEESDEEDTSKSMIVFGLDWKRETTDLFRIAALKQTGKVIRVHTGLYITLLNLNLT